MCLSNDKEAMTDDRHRSHSLTLLPGRNDLNILPFLSSNNPLIDQFHPEIKRGRWWPVVTLEFLSSLAWPPCIVEVGQELRIVNCGGVDFNEHENYEAQSWHLSFSFPIDHKNTF